MSSLRNLTFDHLLVYIAVIETGSLTRAARRLSVGKSVVSKNLQRLELELGASLIVRTTRRISVTEAGASFFETCREIARLADEAVSNVSPAAHALRGTLRVASSVEYSATVIAPVLARLRSKHPELCIEMMSGDRYIDLVAEGVDVAIRVGELTDSSHRALRIDEVSKWLVASPEFLARNTLPVQIGDAAQVPFVALSVLPNPSRCNLIRAAGQDAVEINFEACLIADTMYACRAAARNGAGIALLSDFTVQADLDAGRLVRVYTDWSSPALPVHALFPPGKHTPPKVRTFVDTLRAHVGAA
ncbi:LysR family transcriptional regulator [Paraburkholderia sp. 2C]|jgi:DNA-binding transcriptional LysR family regulator